MSVFGSLFGASDEPPSADKIREQRVRSARANQSWTEIDETALVRRERWLVHADSDLLYNLHRGAVWDRGRIAFHENVEMVFYVDRDGDVVLLEECNTPRTWSEIVARRARHLRAAS